MHARRSFGKFILALVALGSTAAVPERTFAQEQENPTTPGQIPDPSTYQGSSVLQQQSDQQDQQFRQRMEPQQPEPPPQQSYSPDRSSSGTITQQNSKGSAHATNTGPDTPAKAIARGDFATALRLARPKALAGDAAAQHTLGYLYETGSGVPLNYETAASWNRKAAEQGNVGGQADLGWMYYKGLGVSRDPVQAYKWLVLAGREDMTARRHMREVAAAITYDEMSEGLSLAQQWTPTADHDGTGPAHQ